MSEVRGRRQEDPMPERQLPRGVTPCLRSGAAAESARLQRCRNSQEELPHVRGQRLQWRGATPRPRSGAVARGSYPPPEARDDSREEQPHIQGVVAARVQEGLEELFHTRG